jgi:FkbM family methyltransferase
MSATPIFPEFRLKADDMRSKKVNYSYPLWKKVPVLRGWITRFNAWLAKRRLLQAYQTFRQCAGHDGIGEVRFSRDGSTFLLNDGRRYLFDPSRAAGWLYSIPFSGTFEEKETEYLRTFVRPGWVCLDVGACFGWYTLLLSRLVGSGGRVHAFEPVRSNLGCLRENVALNKSENIVLNDVALGDKAGKVTLYLPKRGVSASLRQHGSKTGCETLETTVVTLNEYVNRSGLERLDFIKADIEGAELLLLNGGLETLKRFKPSLMLEIQAHSTRLFGYAPDAIFTLLADMGYQAYYVGPDAALIPYTPSGNSQLPDYNFIFQHKGAGR